MTRAAVAVPRLPGHAMIFDTEKRQCELHSPDGFIYTAKAKSDATLSSVALELVGVVAEDKESIPMVDAA